jgi:hypothetical protein
MVEEEVKVEEPIGADDGLIMEDNTPRAGIVSKRARKKPAEF